MKIKHSNTKPFNNNGLVFVCMVKYFSVYCLIKSEIDSVAHTHTQVVSLYVKLLYLHLNWSSNFNFLEHSGQWIGRTWTINISFSMTVNRRFVNGKSYSFFLPFTIKRDNRKGLMYIFNILLLKWGDRQKLCKTKVKYEGNFYIASMTIWHAAFHC